MKKKSKIFFFVFIVLINNAFAERFIPEKEISLVKENYKYTAKANWANDYHNWIGTIEIESINSPKYFYQVPIYSISINDNLEADVQWVFIKKLEFINNETILITNEDNNTFEFNIYSYEVIPINTETQLFEFDIKKFKSKPILQKNKNQIFLIFEKDNRLIIQNNKRFKYTGIQPEKKNLYIIEDVVSVAENILFQIYGEETIRKEQPYYIKKYKNKWIISGSLPDDLEGGVFEITINEDNSQIESLIHGK